jgi:hypothetical protein
MKNYYTGIDERGKWVKVYFPLPMVIFFAPFFVGLIFGFVLSLPAWEQFFLTFLHG